MCVQTKLRLGTFFCFVLSILLLYLPRYQVMVCHIGSQPAEPVWPAAQPRHARRSTRAAAQACRSHQTTWLGLTPLYLVQTTALVCWLYVFMPRATKKPPPLLQVCLRASSHGPQIKIL